MPFPTFKALYPNHASSVSSADILASAYEFIPGTLASNTSTRQAIFHKLDSHSTSIQRHAFLHN